MIIKIDLLRPPFIFRRTSRTQRNYNWKFESESEESDLSDISIRTIGFWISYKYIIRTTPLSLGSSVEEELATDTESAETDRIADKYYEEIEGPAWVWEEFYLTELFEEPPEEEQNDLEDMAYQVPTFSGYTASESVITFINDLELYATARTLNTANKGALILAAIWEPAKTHLNITIAVGLAVSVDAASYTAVIVWLWTIYHTVDIQQ